MSLTKKYTLIIVLICFCTINSYSQSDSTKAKKIDTEISSVESTNQLKATSTITKVASSPNSNLNIHKKLNTDAINKNLKKYSSSKNQNFLLKDLPEDNDIIGKKYWKGKDVTHKKLISNFSLGTINSTTKTVKIECRDYSYVDGDRIKIYLNEQVISDNIGLKGNYYVLYVNLKQGYNRIDFQALNQGFSGPNTAEFRVYDDLGNLISAKQWNLATSETATLGIIKK